MSEQSRLSRKKNDDVEIHVILKEKKTSMPRVDPRWFNSTKADGAHEFHTIDILKRRIREKKVYYFIISIKHIIFNFLGSIFTTFDYIL